MGNLSEVDIKFVEAFIRTRDPRKAANQSGSEPNNSGVEGKAFMERPEIRKAIHKRKKELVSLCKDYLVIDYNEYMNDLHELYNDAKKYRRIDQALKVLKEIADASGVNQEEIKEEKTINIIANLEETSI